MLTIAIVIAESNPDDIEWATALPISIGCSLVTLAAAWFAVRTYGRVMSGELGPNGWSGIRTKATTRSVETWAAAHQAGGPLSIRGLQAIAAGALASVPVAAVLAVARDGEATTYMGWWAAILFIGVAIGLVPVLYGTLLGHRAAQAVSQ